ncbi:MULTISPECIES: putative type VI secretion system effector [Enterobacterales]|uniref:putative type VI secretion system effector n=1 Tax=Enterobacterales TaxID=91347 RepID=UPI002ED799EA
MSTLRHIKDAIDFNALESRKSTLETSIEVDMQWKQDYPDSALDVDEKIKNAKAELYELNKTLGNKPPLPVLPPKQGLIKLSGILEEIEILYVRGYFTDREYEPEEFSRQESRRQWGSVLLAMIGESAAASVNSQEQTRMSDGYDFVKGKINGISFHGWLGRVVAQKGDYVELVATKQNGHYEVYALAIPDLNVISVLPRCYQGVRARATSEAWGCFILPIIIIGLFTVGGVFADGFHFSYQYIQGLWRVCVVALALGAISCPFIYSKMLKKPKPTNIMAQRIFTALGLENAEKINLKKLTKKMLKSGPPKQADRIMPDKSSWLSYYYYY